MQLRVAALERVLFSVIVTATVLFATAARAECGCSGNPSRIGSDSSGPCLRYSAPSGSSNDITYRFAEAYACGHYVTGEYFVVAPSGASVTAVTPAASAGRHGLDVNPSPKGPQRWDDRLGDYAASLALPYTASAGSSLVKYVSDNPAGACDGPSDEKSCGRFAAVVTVVADPPLDPAHTFRPPFVGTYKPSLSTLALRSELLSRVDRGPCRPPSLATARAWTSHLRLDYTSDSVTCDLMSPEDALPGGRPWSTDIWANDSDVYAWLQLADVCDTPPCSAEQDLAAKLPVLIGYVQHGIDVWGVDRTSASLFRGGGGNGGGKLFAYVFAAAMLPDPELRADLRAIDASHFFESASYYVGANGVALWGQPTGSEREYWNDFSEQSTRTIRDPYKLIDGGFEPGGWYQDNTAKPTQYSALLMRLTPALLAAWPVNGPVILEYADRWVEHGAIASPDVCAKVGGQYGVAYGPDGNGSCIKGSGRVPSLDGNNRNGGNRKRDLGECMWKTFRECAETCSCLGQVCDSTSGNGGATSNGGGTSNGGRAANGGGTSRSGAASSGDGGSVATSRGGAASVGDGGRAGNGAAGALVGGGSASETGARGNDSANGASHESGGCSFGTPRTPASWLPVLIGLGLLRARRRLTPRLRAGTRRADR